MSASEQILNPSSLRSNKYSGRHPSMLDTPHFCKLKESIASNGGNFVPVLVRPSDSGTHEIVYGALRVQACIDLHLPVMALVDDGLDELGSIRRMFLENHPSGSLSDFEQGQLFRKVLDAQCFPSQRKLAEGLGVDLMFVADRLWLADLQPEILKAFDSVLSLQASWKRPLKKAMDRDPMTFAHRAMELSAGMPIKAKVAYAELKRVGSR